MLSVSSSSSRPGSSPELASAWVTEVRKLALLNCDVDTLTATRTLAGQPAASSQA
jgi:hypothetical protein